MGSILFQKIFLNGNIRSGIECCVAAAGSISEGAYLNDLVRWPGSTIQPMDVTFQPADMMNKAEIQVPKRLLRDEALDWFERNDGPPVIAFRFDSQQGLAREVDWHHHQRAQLICVERGSLTTRTSHGTWSLAPGSAGWMPPLEPHTVTLDGPLRGWGMALAAPACATPPADPACWACPSWRRRWPTASANGRSAMTPRPSASTSSTCCWTRSAPRRASACTCRCRTTGAC